MIRFTIDKDYVIDTDEKNYTAKIDTHNFDKKGNTLYKIIGYYGTIEGAIEGIYEYMIKNDLHDNDYCLSEAINVIKKYRNEMIAKFDEELHKEKI